MSTFLQLLFKSWASNSFLLCILAALVDHHAKLSYFLKNKLDPVCTNTKVGNLT
jgi:hypothetical protein